MPRKIQPTYTKAKGARIVCMGDSLTSNYIWGVGLNKFYPRLVQDALNALGCSVLCRNFGVSGETTGQMLARSAVMTQYEVPDMAIIYGGTNDAQYSSTVQASPTPTATTFSVASGKGVNLIAGTYILVDGVRAKILSVATDAITLTAARAGGAPSTGNAVAIDTQGNIEAMGSSLVTAGCSKIVVVGRHYDNFSTGGDTVGSPLAAGTALRAKQSAAATTLGAAYCDLWQYMADRITATTDTQGSFSWHVFDSNIHLNTYGESIVSAAVVATIQSKSGWVDSLE